MTSETNGQTALKCATTILTTMGVNKTSVTPRDVMYLAEQFEEWLDGER